MAEAEHKRYIHGQPPSDFWHDQRRQLLDAQDAELDAEPDLCWAARKLARNEGHSSVARPPRRLARWWWRHRAAVAIAGTLCAGSFFVGPLVEAYVDAATTHPPQFDRLSGKELRLGLRNPELLARLGLCEKVLGLQRDLELLYAQDEPDLPDRYRDRAELFEEARSLAAEHNVPCETDTQVYELQMSGYAAKVEAGDYTVFSMTSREGWCRSREYVIAHRDTAPNENSGQYYVLAEVLGQEVSRQQGLDC